MTHKTPIQTAAARGESTEIHVPIDLGPAEGGVTVLRFRRSLGVNLAAAIETVQEAAGKSMLQQLRALHEFAVAFAVADQRDTIRYLLDRDAIDFDALIAVYEDVIAELTARPTTPPGSSSGGSPTTGTRSTDGVPPEGSTPLLSPPTGS